MNENDQKNKNKKTCDLFHNTTCNVMTNTSLNADSHNVSNHTLLYHIMKNVNGIKSNITVIFIIHHVYHITCSS